MTEPRQPFDVTYKPISKPSVGNNGYEGFFPGRVDVLKKGSARPGWPVGGKSTQSKPLESDIILEHDLEIVLRDGTKLYADICRPADLAENEKVPIILSWSPYGKKYSAMDMLPVCTWKCGVIPSDLSGYEKFEGVDPLYWCPRGYAVASVDQRGTGNSEGKVHIMGQQDAEDGYDTIECLAKRPYCNGKVGMAGNSHLAISQYFIAAQHPPSLAAIAPWEGLSDLYRDQFVRGGIFNISNFNLISKLIIQGPNGVEDFDAQYRKYPHANSAYWQDKRVDMSKINVPAYLSGSDVSSLHTQGTLRAFLEIQEPEGQRTKFLRWSPWQEWFDLYSKPENMEDLRGFFDRFLKDIDNKWDVETPRVRMSVLQMGDKEPIENIVVPDWPLPNTQYTDFYLAEDGKLALNSPSAQSTVSYSATEESAFVSFTHTFDKQTRLIGLPKAHLFMSCNDHDDLCVFVSIRKLDPQGNLIKHVQVSKDRRWVQKYADIPLKDHSGVIIHAGSLGVLRASRRAIDRDASLHPQWPHHTHDKDEKVAPGTIVELEIGIWHCGVQFDVGESIRIDISGVNPAYPELKEMNGARPEDERNRGTHVLHFGPEHPSRIILPVIPE